MVSDIYIDEDLSDDLPSALRALGYDAVHAREAGNERQINPRQLAFAARHGRLLVTANAQDFRMLHEAWVVWSTEWPAAGLAPHPGIALVPNPNAMRTPAIARILDELARGIGGADPRNRLYRWKATTGWEDQSALRGPVARL